MKAILEFNLETEREEFNFAVNGVKWYLVCNRIDAILRAQIKYPSDDTPQEVIDALQKVRNELYKTVDAQDLTL